MPMDHQVTRLIDALRGGDDAAFDRMLPLVYDDLRRIARRQLRGQRAGLTLNTTALVHESYLKLVGGSRLEWSDRVHFFAVAALGVTPRTIRRDWLKARMWLYAELSDDTDASEDSAEADRPSGTRESTGVRAPGRSAPTAEASAAREPGGPAADPERRGRP